MAEDETKNTETTESKPAGKEFKEKAGEVIDKASEVAGKTAEKERRAGKGRARMTATEQVISIIKKSPKGIDVSGLKAKSGFEDKKIRNIVFRLSKEGTIRRVGRGVYAMN